MYVEVIILWRRSFEIIYNKEMRSIVERSGKMKCKNIEVEEKTFMKRLVQ